MKSRYCNRKSVILLITAYFLLLMVGISFAANTNIATIQVESSSAEFYNGDVAYLTGTGFEANDRIFFVSLTLIDDNSRIVGDVIIQDFSLKVDSDGKLSGSLVLDEISSEAKYVEVVVYAEKSYVRGSNRIVVYGDEKYTKPASIKKAAGTVLVDDDNTHGSTGDSDGLAEVSEDIDITGTGWTGNLNLIGQREFSNVGGTSFIQSTSIATGNCSITSGNLVGYSTTTGSFDASAVSIRIRVINDVAEYTDSDRIVIEELDPPGLTSATVTSFTNIRLVFDEPLYQDPGTGAHTKFDLTGATATAIAAVGTEPTDTWDLTINSISPERNPNITVAYDQANPGSDVLQDAANNEVEDTSPAVTAADQIAPAQPTMTIPTSSTIMDGADVALTATADAIGTDGSMDEVRFEGSLNGSTWDDLGSDDVTTDATYSVTHTFGTEYSYYRAVAVDDAANETESAATVELTDAYRIEITTYPSSPVAAGSNNQFIITIQDNYAQAVSYPTNLSFNLETSASSGGTFWDDAARTTQITSVVINNPDQTAEFYYQDNNAGTSPNITVTESASNLDDDQDIQGISISAATFDHFHVTTSGDPTAETAGTAFNITVTAHTVSHATATDYVGTKSLTWATNASNSPDGTSPTIPANEDQDFTAGVLTLTSAGTFYNSSETPTLTVGDGSLVTTDGWGATGITVVDGSYSEVRIKSQADASEGEYDSNVYGTGTFQGPTQGNSTETFYAVRYDDYGNLLPNPGSGDGTWAETGDISSNFSSTTGPSTTLDFDGSGTGTPGTVYTGTVTYTFTESDATGTLTVDDDSGATVTGFGVTTDGDDNRYVFATWTGGSSGDDGTTGTPTDYDVRWTDESNGPIDTKTEWDNATSVGTGEKPSFTGGGPWHINMSGFPEGNKYFAIRTTDDVGNISVLGSGAYTTSSDYSLPVELTSFEAQSDYSKVTLSWTTASEIENLGFNIYRSNSKDVNNWKKMNENLIPGQGNSAEESDYQFIDKNVVANETYQYKLESVSFNGEIELLQSIEVTIPVPKEYVLFNNHPNPFNPTTNLRFQIPEQSKVSVTIYDVQGHVIKKLVQKATYSAGEHEAQWDATDDFGRKVATGMYIYRFTAGSYQKLGKMMLIK